MNVHSPTEWAGTYPPSPPLPTVVPVQLKPTDGGPSGVEEVRLPPQLQLTVEELDLSVGLGDVLGDKGVHVCTGERRQGNNGCVRRSAAEPFRPVGEDTGMEAPLVPGDVHVLPTVVGEACW